jgi:hypothetical protein
VVPGRARPATRQARRDWQRCESRAVFVEERRRYEQRIYQVIATAVQSGDLRGDLDLQDATLILLSVANWAYTWFSDETDVDDVTARMMSILLSGMGPVRA